MEIVAEYDRETGNITDKAGLVWSVAPNLDFNLSDNTEKMVEKCIKLKNAGFTTDEIIELRRKGLV